MTDQPNEGSPLEGLDLGALLGAAQSMGAQMAEAQEQLAATVVEGTAGGGLVKITATGEWVVQSVSIAPDAVDPDDIATLEDLVLAALRDVGERIAALQAESSPLGGMDLGGLGGMLGGD